MSSSTKSDHRNPSTFLDERALSAFLGRHPTVEFVRYQWVDFCGILRARILTKRRALELAISGKPLVASNFGLEGLFDGNVYFGSGVVGTDQFCPDWVSLRVINAGSFSTDEIHGRKIYNRYAAVMCTISRQYHSHDGKSVGLAMCPRTRLARAVVEAREHYGIEHLVGFEVEFTMLRKTPGKQCPQPLEDHPGHFTVASLRNKSAGLLEKCADELRDAGVPIQQFHPEGRGQYEFVLDPLQPLEAVDAVVLTIDVLKNVLARHRDENGDELMASVYPVGVSSHTTNSCHAHLSIHPPIREEEYLAGILKYLPHICAFSMPSYHSYERMGSYKAGTWVGWGTEDKAMPIRKVKTGHWELRPIDASCNMYLAMAAYIYAGLTGLECKEKLAIKDSALHPDASSSEEVRALLGITSKLPISLKETITQLKVEESEWKKKMGPELIGPYILVKEYEVRVTDEADDDDKLKALYLQFH